MHYLDIFDVVDIEEEQILSSVAIAIQPGTASHYCWYHRKNKEFSFLAEIGSMSVNEARAFERSGSLLTLVKARYEAMDPDRITFARVHAEMWNDASKISPEVTASAWLLSQDYDFTESE